MHKVLILSDSHGMDTELQVIRNRHPADAYIHCGDSELSDDAIYLQGFVTVQGNCDWTASFPTEQIVEVGDLRFFITHGHHYAVKSSLLQLQYRAEEVAADIVCFGHSHVAYLEQHDPFLFINPGSIRSPRHFTEPSYVVLEWEGPAEVRARFFHVNGEEIHHFPYKQKFFW